MIQKGVLIGTAAALVLGVAFVAAAVVSRPHDPDPPAAAASRMRITLVAPREPAAPVGGPKLETVPPGAPDVRVEQIAPPPTPPPRAEPRRLEPEARDDDFIDEDETAFADRYPPEPYREGWRGRGYEERPYGRRLYDEDRRDEDRFEPWDPEPPPWWRR